MPSRTAESSDLSELRLPRRGGALRSRMDQLMVLVALVAIWVGLAAVLGAYWVGSPWGVASRLGSAVWSDVWQLLTYVLGTAWSDSALGAMTRPADMGLQGSPPVEATVAEFSGIVTIGADGTAKVDFDIPDFNGTVRVMAVAWSADKLGHGQADVIVRDAVALTASGPRFLTLGDEARLDIAVHNVEGPQGAYKVELINGEKTVDVQDNKYTRGPIALQYGAGTVKFKNVKLRTL